jgi:hypothetical protein
MTNVPTILWNNPILQILTCTAALLIAIGRSVNAGDAITFTVSPGPEVVYSYQRQRCDTRTIPDSPARAYRREDGSVVMIAAHFNNRFFEGSDFEHLSPNCNVLSQGAESPNPGEFDDRFWIQSLIPLGGGRLMALASHEYMGYRYAGVREKGAFPTCWYVSVVGLEGNERDLSFTLLPRAQRVIAGSNRRFDPSIKAAGFQTVTKTVFNGDYAYFIAWTDDAAEPGGRGNCLFRAPRRDLVNGWQMLSSGHFVRPPDPYPTDGQEPMQSRCDRLGGPDISGKARSLVWLESKKQWMFIWTARAKESGAFYATSPDLRNWSSAALLAAYEPPWGSDKIGVFHDYPSAIDRNSPSLIFQTAGDSFYLYLTRLN